MEQDTTKKRKPIFPHGFSIFVISLLRIKNPVFLWNKSMFFQMFKFTLYASGILASRNRNLHQVVTGIFVAGFLYFGRSGDDFPWFSKCVLRTQEVTQKMEQDFTNNRKPFFRNGFSIFVISLILRIENPVLIRAKSMVVQIYTLRHLFSHLCPKRDFFCICHQCEISFFSNKKREAAAFQPLVVKTPLITPINF